MRMVKIKDEKPCLEEVISKFVLVKESQHTGEEAMRDYRNCLRRFLNESQNSIEYEKLESDTLRFFSNIPNTSPARYNKPFQNVNALFNWMVEQEYIPRSPIKAHKLHKRKDDGNIQPVSIDNLRAFISGIDRKTYTGLRDYTIILVMLDTGIRTKELLSLRNSDYHRMTRSLLIAKTVAKTQKRRTAFLDPTVANALESYLKYKPLEWEDWLFPNFEGKQLKVTHLDKSFVKYSNASGIKITPYQLRHSFATLFLKNGGDLFSLQHLMGHSDLRMTRRYTELDEEYIKQQHQTYSPITLLSVPHSKRFRKIK